jgi:pimeloyl-ACP methyl ester carboxylesterase
MSCTTRLIEADGRKVEIVVGGEGDPLLFLHGGERASTSLPFIQALAKTFRVYAPVHPGFGESERTASFDSVGDLVYHYLDVLDVLGLERVHVVGHSFGGWIAAELAVGHQHRIERLVLVNAMGIKVEQVTLLNLFMLPIKKMVRLLYSDPPVAVSTPVLSDREALARYVWQRLYDPKLRDRLRRIKIPALVVWGEEDELLPQEYGRVFAASIPNARFVSVEGLGHALRAEQNARLVKTLTAFLKEGNTDNTNFAN